MKYNWTEPRVYIDLDGSPRRIAVYDKDDGREVASVGLFRDDDAAHFARVMAEFAMIAASPEMLDVLEKLLHDIDNPNFTPPRKAILETADRAHAAIAAVRGQA